MEIFELRYFLGVARTENIHRAAERLRVSPASLSKAIARIEAEVGVRLFSREGRNIRLTPQGEFMRQRATAIVDLEAATRMEILGHEGSLQVRIAGSEVLLAHLGVEIADKIRDKQPKASFEFAAGDDEAAIKKVRLGEAHLALTTAAVGKELTGKKLGTVKFKTVVGAGHPLYAGARAKRAITVGNLLEHGFASPAHAFLGRVGHRQSPDGWRDDAFPRKIAYVTSSLSLLTALVENGRAVGYLPDYLAEKLKVEILRVHGCPYTCEQEIHLVAKRPQDSGWLNRLF